MGGLETHWVTFLGNGRAAPPGAHLGGDASDDSGFLLDGAVTVVSIIDHNMKS